MNWGLGLNFYSYKTVLFNPMDLNNPETQKVIDGDKFHTYLIGKRKKLFFSSCDSSNDKFNESTFYKLNEHNDKEFLEIKHLKRLVIHGTKDGMIDVTLDNKPLQVRDFAVVNNFFYSPETVFSKDPNESLPSDLEIMYIGQAFGKAGKRKIDDRLSNHEKLLEVALSIIGRFTSEEILIIGLTLEVNDIATSFVTIGEEPTVTEESILKLQEDAQMRLSDNQALTVFEASMIRYFQPEYNTEYKNSFPKFGVASYAELYQTKFDYSAFTIDTREIGMRTYSQACPKRLYIHSEYFPLNTQDSKKSFFDYLKSL